MPRKLRKTKRQRGSALSIMLVFTSILMVLGVGMLTVANNRAVHTTISIKNDKQFYAAESAAQLAAQMLMKELKEEDFYSTGSIAKAAQITEMVKLQDHYEKALDERLQEIHEKINEELKKTKFNGEDAELDPVQILEFGEWLKADYNESAEWGAVYLNNPTFVISTRSGGRNVVVEVPADTWLDIVPGSSGSDGGGGVLAHLGGLQSNKTGGIYGEGNNDLYDYYMAELTKRLAASDADYAANSGDFTKPSGFPDASAFNANNALNAQYINTWSVVELGKAGQTTTYPNLEYINTGNGLTIRGTVYCPKLKGVKTQGNVEINGIFHCPSLETFSTGGGTLTIQKNAAINPMTVDATGKITDFNKPTGSCKFYIGSNLKIYCDAELNWCIFNSRSDVFIYYGSGGKLTSNSIFYQRANLIISGTASSDTSRVIPQFYARGYVDFTGSTPGSVTGIFMTPSNNMIFNNGNGIPDNTQFTGLFVGNCDKTYQSLPPPDYGAHNVPIGMYNNNGSPRDDFEVNDFDSVTSSLLMDGDWLSNSSATPGTPGTDETETEIDFTCDFKNLNIREYVGK